MLISFFIVWTDTCRGQGIFPECDVTIMSVVVLGLSILCGVITWKVNWEKTEMFLSGFTTGAFAAGVYYIVLYRDNLLGGFLDAETAKPYMVALLIIMVFVGTVIGCLTQILFRQLLMMGTAIVGSFVILCAFLIFVPHWWSTADWIAWGVLSVLAYLVQLLITPPDYEMMDAEERAEYKQEHQDDP